MTWIEFKEFFWGFLAPLIGVFSLIGFAIWSKWQ